MRSVSELWWLFLQKLATLAQAGCLDEVDLNLGRLDQLSCDLTDSSRPFNIHWIVLVLQLLQRLEQVVSQVGHRVLHPASVVCA